MMRYALAELEDLWLILHDDISIFQELIVMESCHSFIHDMLKHMGPTNAMDPRLQEEINNFPPEAKVSMEISRKMINFNLRE